MKSSELRKQFLTFFAERGHSVRPSSSLIPEDKTLLFTVAGMVPFKNYFLANVPLIFTRAATSQKCIRTNDIDNVGRTRRHHTFFEMLGNFSFGDYFKEDAIRWAWEFLTDVVKLPKEKLYVTVYLDDDAAYEIWNKTMKIPAERIFRLGKDTNFWEMGTVGPCGYCSEIYFDQEYKTGQKVTKEEIETLTDRFLEVWNLVFTEFDKKEDGSLGALKQKNIDTGMGLERLAAVSQGVLSNFETDLFMPIIKHISEKAGVQYGKETRTDLSLRVIADHARGVTFLIADGVLPSNEGRGYVLRRLIRRAIRHGRLLKFTEPFLYQAVPVVLSIMGEAYPELKQRMDYVTQIIKMEEDKFQETMDKGMEILSAELDSMKASGKNILSGEVAFKLYDTYGFPVEITEEILRENKLEIDKKGFETSMEKQREAARKAWKGVDVALAGEVPEDFLKQVKETVFTGYEGFETNAKVVALFKKGARIKEAKTGDQVLLVLDRTPFYAESGGQTGDAGEITVGKARAEVSDTQKLGNVFIHKAKVIEHTIGEGDQAKASVDTARRSATMKNHTATHLLQASLRSIIGAHVEQAGSYVGPDRLRFDFTHFAQLTAPELAKVEKLVNEWAQSAQPVLVEVVNTAEAKSRGAMALFDEKYGDKVRLVSVPGVSMELCAGTHLHNTGEIGTFKIISSGSTAAGIRRIEAVTGMESYALFGEYESVIADMREKFKASTIKDLGEKVKKLLNETKEMEREIKKTREKETVKSADDYLKDAPEIDGVKIITAKLSGADKNAVRSLADILKAKAKKAVIVIANENEGRGGFLCALTDNVLDKYDASKIVKAVAAICGGSGGGKKDMAEAGAKDTSKLEAALKAVVEVVKG